MKVYGRIRKTAAAAGAVALLQVTIACGLTVQAVWNSNSEADLDVYRVHWGTTSRGSATNTSQFSYDNHQDVPTAPSPSTSISNLTEGVLYYFSVTARDTNANESVYSQEAVFGPGMSFIAFNDLAWFSPQTTANITTYTTTNGSSARIQRGHLLDHTSGDRLPVSVEITGGAAPHETQGAEPATGTDAHAVFDGNVECESTLTYGADGADLVLSLGGLDPEYRYELVLYADRDGSAYVGGSSRDHYGTLSGADSFRNFSSPGTLLRSNAVPNDTAYYNAGYNNPTGLVTRFMNIDPGSDRAVTLTLDQDSTSRHYSYVNAFMLKATPARSNVIARAGSWRYLEGTTEASAPATAWRLPGFNDSGWATGDAPFGYSSQPAEGPFGTPLTNTYTCVYLRKPFVLDAGALVNGVTVEVEVDDGFIMWVNGEEVARTNVLGSAPPYDATAESSTEPAEHVYALSKERVPSLAAGTNLVAVQLFNAGTSSSDLKLDVAVAVASDAMPASWDSDQDGLPDGWEDAELNGTGESGTDNGDNDDLSNLEEYIAGTDPATNANPFAVDVSSVGADLVVSFPTILAQGVGYEGMSRHYALEVLPDLQTNAQWGAVSGYADVPATGGTVVYTNSGGAGGTALYRSRVWLE